MGKQNRAAKHTQHVATDVKKGRSATQYTGADSCCFLLALHNPVAKGNYSHLHIFCWGFPCHGLGLWE